MGTFQKKAITFEVKQLEPSNLAMLWGHPHSTYALRGEGVVLSKAYACVQGGGEGSKQNVRTQKK